MESTAYIKLMLFLFHGAEYSCRTPAGPYRFFASQLLVETWYACAGACTAVIVIKKNYTAV